MGEKVSIGSNCEQGANHITQFSKSLFPLDSDLKKLMRKVTRLVLNEIRKESIGFARLPKLFKSSFKKNGLNLLTLIEPDFSDQLGEDTYTLEFEYGRSKETVELIISSKTGRYRWNRLIE